MAGKPEFPESFYKAAEDKGFTLRGSETGYIPWEKRNDVDGKCSHPLNPAYVEPKDPRRVDLKPILTEGGVEYYAGNCSHCGSQFKSLREVDE